MSQVQYVFNYERNRGVDSSFIFVIMSFKSQFDDTYAAFKSAGKMLEHCRDFVIKRADEGGGSYKITDKIEEYIEKASLILCDVTELNPNVFYEFGYARAKDKDIVITAQNGTELPFDVHNYRTIFYKSAMDLQLKVVKELEQHFRIKT